MAKKWIMVRLQAETHARLLWVRQLLDEMANAGVQGLPDFNEQSTEIPLDGIVTWLLDHYMSYRMRPRRKQGAGKKATPKQDVSGIGGIDPSISQR